MTSLIRALVQLEMRVTLNILGQVFRYIMVRSNNVPYNDVYLSNIDHQFRGNLRDGLNKCACVWGREKL